MMNDQFSLLARVWIAAAIATSGAAAGCNTASSSEPEPGQVPPGFPAGVPPPPDSILIGVNNLTGGGSSGTVRGASYLTTRSVDYVHDFYKKVFSVDGWAIVAELPVEDVANPIRIFTVQKGPGTRPSDNPIDIAFIIGIKPGDEFPTVTVNY